MKSNKAHTTTIIRPEIIPAADPRDFEWVSKQGISTPEEKERLAKNKRYQRFNARSKQLGFE